MYYPTLRYWCVCNFLRNPTSLHITTVVFVAPSLHHLALQGTLKHSARTRRGRGAKPKYVIIVGGTRHKREGRGMQTMKYSKLCLRWYRLPPALPHRFHSVIHRRTVKPNHAFEPAGLARSPLGAHSPGPTRTQKTAPPRRPPVQLRHVILPDDQPAS